MNRLSIPDYPAPIITLITDLEEAVAKIGTKDMEIQTVTLSRVTHKLPSHPLQLSLMATLLCFQLHQAEHQIPNTRLSYAFDVISRGT